MYRIYNTNYSGISPESQTDKAIVLDLDETLVHTQSEDEVESIEYMEKLGIFTTPELMDLRKRIFRLPLHDVASKKGKGDYMEMWGVTRPHMKDFLLFCFSYFRIVAVWSAGLPRYVEEIVDFIFQDLPRPHVVFTRDECKSERCEKPLLAMVESDDFLKEKMSLKNTLIIDDQKKSFIHNNAENGVLIPGYEPDATVDAMRTNDIALLQLKQWFDNEEVRKSKDVRKLDKEKIFTVPLKSD